MKHLGHVDLNQNFLQNITLEPVLNYPITPKVGSFILKDKRVLVCVDVSGVPVWVPLTSEINTVMFDQDVASTTWTIPHSLNSSSVMVQVLDQDNKAIIPDVIDTSVFNQVTLTFTSAQAGRAILMMGQMFGMSRTAVSYENEYTTSDTWVVSHNLGYEPVLRVFIGNQEVQPETVTHDSVNQATVTFTSPQSGTVRAI